MNIKWIFTAIVFLTGLILNIIKIPIQDNFKDILIALLGAVLFGDLGKKITEILKEKKL